MKIFWSKFALLGFGLALLSGRELHLDKDVKINADNYYISLAVTNLSTSKDFYKKLGFEPVPGAGSIEENWLLLENGIAKIGLFQGLFPKNTITFNPDDARKIYERLMDQDLETTYAQGLEKKDGPCSFSLNDPDGNPILFDQH